MIYGLTDRAFLLSHPMFHQKNIEFIIDILLLNGYPLDLIFEKIRSRLKTLIYANKNSNRNKNKYNKNRSDDINKKIMVIPYINKISELVATTIDKSQYIIGYRVLNHLGGFIRAHKDRNHPLKNNNVVYKIMCKDCDASYVGQTKRQLKTRVNEHRYNLTSLSANPSVITEHILQHSHSFDWESVRILDTETNFYKRSVSEMLHIKEQSNGLNAQKDTELLDNAYSDILDVLSEFRPHS